MRRSDKESLDKAVFTELMEKEKVGHLAIIQPDGVPRSIPLNFVYLGGALYFHGARSGEKFEAISREPSVSFSVSQVLSYIPSHFLGSDPCEATHYYRSALVYGEASVVAEHVEKRRALTALMEKYQPGIEGNDFSRSSEKKDRNVERTAVFKLNAERIVLKVNLGADLPETGRRELCQKLERRGFSEDMETIRLLRLSRK